MRKYQITTITTNTFDAYASSPWAADGEGDFYWVGNDVPDPRLEDPFLDLIDEIESELDSV